jgi:amidase
MKTTAGLIALIDTQPKHWSPLFDKFVDAEVLVLGKANLTALNGLYVPSSSTLKREEWSPRGGHIGSVYDKRPNSRSTGPDAHHCGSSSGGCALAVAAGFCAAAIGEETSGSIVLHL